MSNAKELVLAGAEKASVLSEYSQEQVAILRNHVAPGFTEAELAYGLTVAKARGLDPFQRQVYFTKRRQKSQDGWTERVTVEPTIDGFRIVASRTGEMDGTEEPMWCGSDGVWFDVWLSNQPPAAAKIVVYRKGHRKPYSATARFDEYAQRTRDGGLGAMWAKMPATMLAKCAEALALRRAFPEALSGLYAHEEMGQQENDAFATLPKEQPRAAVAEIAPRPVIVAAPVVARASSAQPAYREKPQAKPTPNERRRSDGLPEQWNDDEPVPAAIQLWWKPLQAAGETPVRSLPIEIAELVAEQCANARARAEGSPKASKLLLELLDAIGEAAATRVIAIQSLEVQQ